MGSKVKQRRGPTDGKLEFRMGGGGLGFKYLEQVNQSSYKDFSSTLGAKCNMDLRRTMLEKEAWFINHYDSSGSKLWGF
jgi:hypothetical protein